MARLRFVDPPATAPAGLPLRLELIVENGSEVAWPIFTAAESHRVRIGYYWRDASGRVISEDIDGDRLPYDLRPGQSAMVPVSIPVGVPAGDYQLSVAVTQGADWFEGAGQMLRIEVVPHLDLPRGRYGPRPERPELRPGRGIV